MQATDQLIVLSSQAVSCELGGETVILDIHSGQYFALSEIGGQIWSLLESPCSFSSLCNQLMNEYDIEPEQCHANVSAFLQELSKHGLIEEST